VSSNISGTASRARAAILQLGVVARLLLLSFSMILTGQLSNLVAAEARKVDFEREIQPIFANHCLQCHGPDKQKGEFRLDRKEAALKGGENHAPDIQPGHAAESPLIQFVTGAVPEMKMPKKGDPLTAREIDLLRAWIDQGANWPEQASGAIAPLHWSLKAITRPAVPASDRKLRSKNPIDAFVQARLNENKLTLSREADRRTLIRRLYVDLVGLLPTPEETRAFESDRRSDAYEQLVERLLASPHYGERWARHWLDVVRFAETTGFEVNTPRPNAWPYRDYVVEAFNDDKPYDQFVLEQLAGDVFGEDAATGFIVAGPDDKVKSPDPVLTSNQRADELHDMVSTTSSTFLALTVGCARCHNHKFDPIPQTDYYAMRAVFEGVQHGDRRMRSPGFEEKEKQLSEARRSLLEIDAQLVDFEPLAQVGLMDTNRLRAAVHPRRNVERFKPVLAKLLRFTINKTSDAEPCIDELEVFTAEPQPRNVAFASAGTKASASSVYPNSDIHRLEHINDGKYGNSRSWISNERGKGWVELEFPEPVTIQRIVWARDREQKFADRLATDYRIEAGVGSNEWQVIASSADREKYVAGKKAKPDVSLAGLDPAQKELATKLIAQRSALEKKVAALTQLPMIYGGNFSPQPEPTYRLHRGDPMQKREVIPPGTLSAIPIRFSPGEKLRQTLTENQKRRLALAEWIVNPQNPLPARVMVNRIWQYHFGEGLVSTPSDFGVNGAKPTNPELLDWLASEFMQPMAGQKLSQPWSIKHIQRLIVTSAAYRQASDPRNDGLAVDAGSRLLWRYPERRVEAEAIRDSILQVSGKLDLRMGGPGFSFFEPNDNYVRVYASKKEFGEADFRRMVYGTVVRQRPDGVFGAFDCPDGGQIAPKRTRSTTPLQALNLLNSGFIMQQAHFLAERLQREAGNESQKQVRRAFELAFLREPDAEELKASTRLIASDGLVVFCRALFNANEFVFVF